ncbi:MAG: ABC transporter permease [Candidatus Thermoplasmatota archaeon]|nr:ABC transporter permease [Candidatus Thermoplasmatota archaeon]
MRLTKILGCSFDGLRRKKWRTFLTIIGVTITIMLIVSNISMMEGFKEYYVNEVKCIGSNWLFVSPGKYEESAQGGWQRVTPYIYPLTIEDSENISNAEHVVYASPIIEGGIFLPLFNKSFALSGITSEYFSIFRLTLERGELLNDSYIYEEGSDIPVIVGYEVAKILNNTVRAQGIVNITNYNFTVIGILNHKVAPFFMPSFDRAMFIPVAIAMDITGKGNELDKIAVEVDSYENIDIVASRIKEILKESHYGIEDFWVVSLADVVELTNRQLGQFDILTQITNLLALVVAGVVILVVMIMTVTERKREIGIMRAVGAERKHILAIFLGEAGIITLTSYLIGSVLGFMLVSSIKVYLKGMFAFINVSKTIPYSMVVAFYTCVPLCLIFALYPAWKATKVSPVEAIRYE